jgi:SAM-dependent methyltransferase
MQPGVCPRCGVEPEKLVRRARSPFDNLAGSFDVRACPGCGMWITSPRPIEEDLELIYPDDYLPYRVPQAPAPAGPDGAELRGDLLDVGCGAGSYLEKARKEGWRGSGIEWSPQAAAVARSRGFEVIVGDALTVGFPDRRFDRVRSAHVLEHVVDPVRLLERLAAATKPDGIVEIIVPNPRSVAARLFRNHWQGLELPRHLFHYRAEDVADLARLAGLEVVGIRHYGTPSPILWSFDRILTSLGRRPRTRLRDRQAMRRLVHPVAALFARFNAGDVVEYRLRRRPPS